MSTQVIDMAGLAADMRVRAALDFIDATDADTVADMAAVTRIPAPSGGEAARAAWLGGRLLACGLDVAPTDEVGNLRARRGTESLPPVILASHLDTVFPADADLTIRHAGGRICAPGISDNGRGIAALIRIAAALQHARIETRHPLELVGTTCEEGAGDLRGVKHLFAQNAECAAFIAVDGAGVNRIVHRAVGSRRVRIVIDGPGGHSWVDRGTANPLHALADGIAASHSVTEHGVSFSVGRIEGGTGVNVIPATAYADIDMRAEEGAALGRLEKRVRAAFADAVTAANARRRPRTGALTMRIAITGDRPGGIVDVNAPIVRYATAATRCVGGTPELTGSSTDANVPLSLGIPAITVGAGGDAGGMHTLEEWYSNEGGAAGIRRLLLLTLALAELA